LRYLDTQGFAQDVLQGQDKCFDVVTTLVAGCWILFAACVLYWISAYVVMRACHAALSERQLREKLRLLDFQFGVESNEPKAATQENEAQT